MSNYKQYYQRIIETNNRGLKLVLGGTGLGKTSGIEEIIKSSKNTNNKFIYIANRVQLLSELKEKLDKDIVIHQKKDYEIVSSIKYDVFEYLVNLETIRNYVKCLKSNNFHIKKISEIEQAYKTIKEGTNNKIYKTENGQDFLNEQTRIFLSFFKTIISTAYKFSKNQINLKNTSKLSVIDYEELINNDYIKKIFPYIDYKYNSNRKLFLITIQKAFYGFFDGRKTVNLYNLDTEEVDKKEINGNKIIFLDEFDFLENDLIQLISRDTEISNPFVFVQQFYFAMRNNKFPYKNFLKNYPDTKTAIDKILKNIDSLKEKYDIDYPEITHFICTQNIEEINQKISHIKKDLKKKNANKEQLNKEIYKLENSKIKGTSIFQTRFSIFNSPIYLETLNERGGSFNLTPIKDEKKATAFALLNIVNQATSEIIRIFKDLQFKEPILYKSMLRFCFENSDKFQKELRIIKQYPLRRKKADTNKDKLIYNGFGLYEIQDLQDEFDPEEINLKYYSIFTTPEKIIWHLSEHNLVFGLSATAEIPRLIKNFDINWFEKELKTKYHKISKEDIIDIKKANEKKQSIRNNSIRVQKSLGLHIRENYENLPETEKKLEEKIDEFINTASRNNEKIFSKNQFKINRVKNFFSSLFLILKNSKEEVKKSTNILFFSSLTQIKFILENYTSGGEDQLFSVSKINSDDTIFEYFEINLDKQDFIIIFYNAEKAKEIQNVEKKLQKYYHLFWQNKPVILITTYPSAGNGVNLQYYSSLEKMQSKSSPDKDIKNIHLLDSVYYYFSPITEEHTATEKSSIIKTNIYYLSKLFTGSKISKGQVKQILTNIRKSGDFNKQYLKTDEGLLNQIAIYIQALGRVERVWNKMDNQLVVLSEDIYNIFETFVTKKDFLPIKSRLKNYFSNNLIEIFKQIEQNYIKQGKIINDYKEEHLKEINNKCRIKIKEFTNELNWLRKNPNTEKAKQIRKKWNKLRISALQHNYLKDDNNIIYEYSGIFETEYFDYITNSIYINKHQQIISKEQANSDFEKWYLDSIYYYVKNNDRIRSYFELRGYELGFNNIGKFFTPYFYQSILAGAIGEEVVKAGFSYPYQQIISPIKVSENGIENSLFELADLKIKNKPWYIDAKNYSEQTIQNFQLKEDDYFYHPKLNEEYFKERALRKLKTIQEFHNSHDCKLIYINAFGDNSRPKKYLNEKFEDVGFDFTKAKIIFIHGVIDRGNPQEYCDAFNTLLTHISKEL